MLVLSRKAGERVSIGEGVNVIVLGVVNGRVKLGFEAPVDVAIRRREMFGTSASEGMSTRVLKGAGEVM